MLQIASNTTKANYGMADGHADDTFKGKSTPLANNAKFDSQMKLQEQQSPTNMGQRSAEFGKGVVQFSM